MMPITIMVTRKKRLIKQETGLTRDVFLMEAINHSNFKPRFLILAFLNHNMKSKLLIILVLIVWNTNGQTVLSGEITFGHKIVKLGIDTSAVSNNQVKNVIVSQMRRSKKALAKTEELYRLSYNSYESLFESLPFLDNDYDPILSKIVSTKKYYQNLLEGTGLQQVDNFGKIYLVDKVITHRRWEIKKETRIIAGYVCKLAITTKKVRGKLYSIKAWYAQSIPVSLGPKDYNGLPGMILGIEEKGNYYYAINVNQSNDLNIEKLAKGEKISSQEYIKMLEKAAKAMRGG